MINRLTLVALYSILLMLPSMAWALNESGDIPSAQSAPVSTVPAHTSPEHPAASESGTTVNATPAPAQPAAVPAKPVPAPVAPVAPVKPAPVPVAPAIPAPAPVAPAKPTPAPVAPAKPTPAPDAPAKPAPAVPVTKAGSTETDTTHGVDIEVFVREECLNCGKALEFVGKLHSLQPQLKINIRDVRKEPAALDLLKRVAQNQGNVAIDYPAFVVGGQLFIGFTEEANTAQLILDNLPLTHAVTDGVENCESGKEPGCGLIPPPPVTKQENFTFNAFGYNIPLVQIGLPLFTVAMGLLDGLNHGSTWVLVLMISLLAPLKDRTLMLSVAGTFIAVQTLIYYVLMAAWLNLFLLIDFSRITQGIVASIGIIAGVIYFKNYLYFGQKLSLSSNEIAKPGIYTSIRKIVESKTLLTAVMGTIVLAIVVQLSEFTYTSVFPALYTQILTLQKLSSLSNYAYLLLYDLAYMMDDLIILTIGVFTLSEGRSPKNHDKLLKLVSSIVVISVGAHILSLML